MTTVWLDPINDKQNKILSKMELNKEYSYQDLNCDSRTLQALEIRGYVKKGKS